MCNPGASRYHVTGMNKANLIHRAKGGKQHLRHTAGCAMLAAVLTVSCGGGGDSTPVTPPAVATPSPAPPPLVPPAPVLQARVSIYSVPSPYSGLYTEGMWIRLITEFEEPVRIVNNPRLMIDVGGTMRYAEFAPFHLGHRFSGEDHQARADYMPRFDYLIQEDNVDLDGFSIDPDAFDFTEGSLLNEAGVEVEVEITSIIPAEGGSTVAGINPRREWLPAREPGQDISELPVDGTPRPRICTDERQRALGRHPILVEEWDGTPFTFYFNTNGMPEHLQHEAERVLEAAQRLSERIEGQLGYSIFEVRGFLENPSVEYPIRGSECPWREPGQIVWMYWERAQANYRCAMTAGSLTFANGSVAHSTFHLFGFDHSPNDWRGEHDYWKGNWMSQRLTGVYVDEEDVGVSFEDVDALRCNFPEGG